MTCERMGNGSAGTGNRPRPRSAVKTETIAPRWPRPGFKPLDVAISGAKGQYSGDCRKKAAPGHTGSRSSPVDMGSFQHMRKILKLSCILAALPLVFLPAPVLLALESAAGQTAPSPEGFQEFLQTLWPLAEQKGISRGTFDAAMAGLNPDPALTAASPPQAEFDKPLKTYLGEAVSARRIAGGREGLRDMGRRTRDDRTPLWRPRRDCPRRLWHRDRLWQGERRQRRHTVARDLGLFSPGPAGVPRRIDWRAGHARQGWHCPRGPERLLGGGHGRPAVPPVGLSEIWGALSGRGAARYLEQSARQPRLDCEFFAPIRLAARLCPGAWK